MAKNDKRSIEELAHISPDEYAELEKMIAEAIKRKGTEGTVGLARTLEYIPISGLGTVRVYVFWWTVDMEPRGRVAWRPYGADEEVAAFQAVSAKYFSDGVQATSVVMRTPDGAVEKLQ